MHAPANPLESLSLCVGRRMEQYEFSAARLARDSPGHPRGDINLPMNRIWEVGSS